MIFPGPSFAIGSSGNRTCDPHSTNRETIQQTVHYFSHIKEAKFAMTIAQLLQAYIRKYSKHLTTGLATIEQQQCNAMFLDIAHSFTLHDRATQKLLNQRKCYKKEQSPSNFFLSFPVMSLSFISRFALARQHIDSYTTGSLKKNLDGRGDGSEEEE